MSTACKVSLALLCLFAVASFLVLTAVAGNKTKQTSSNMVSQLTFCAGPCLIQLEQMIAKKHQEQNFAFCAIQKLLKSTFL